MKSFVVLLIASTVQASVVCNKQLAEFACPGYPQAFEAWLNKENESLLILRSWPLFFQDVERSIEYLSTLLIPGRGNRLNTIDEPMRSAVRRSLIALEILSESGLMDEMKQRISAFYITRHFFNARYVMFSSDLHRAMTLQMMLPRSKPVWDSMKIIATEYLGSEKQDLISLVRKVIEIAVKEKPKWYSILFSLYR